MNNNGKRNCLFTGKPANDKHFIIPKTLLGDEIHNWTNSAPANKSFTNENSKRLPTEEELQLNELFHLKELALIRVKYYELKIQELREKMGLKENTELNDILTPEEDKKGKQIEQMMIEKEAIETSLAIEEKVIQERKKSLWGEN